MRRALLVLVGCLVLTGPGLPGRCELYAAEQAVSAAPVPASSPSPDVDPAVRRNRALLANAAVAGGILTWGLLNWDYFSRAPKTKSEGWFGHDTAEGGADKAGHLWASYTLSHAFAAYYRHIGYPADEATFYGPLSAFGMTGLMEIGDSFSVDHGFSYEDMAANLAGAAAGWLLLKYPQWQKKVDLRLEYRPELSDLEGDFATDYQHSRYLLALKAEGFERVRHPWLQALELRLGYYARNYDSWTPGQPDRRRRYLYLGIGLNVGRLLRPFWKTRLFDYLQVPYTDIQLRRGVEQ
ncbi:uncharacterized protein YfiM (DUF2279 family) [Geothermobacter ehrlichii]|uniref:Uncharacterized protein YfiM (DUF2279 family) n=1 Tax=Geothermobacter ehrlichii TaxID=213224 RepID=A0A5D3WJP1_9BACT|nr:DUF2279 domain-containing protein [Geothermobacter ehrlichii]TYO98267.1 uncharacterized protein YfiM (DUF2279 family) [Geothermobacter ehrlichii]